MTYTNASLSCVWLVANVYIEYIPILVQFKYNKTRIKTCFLKFGSESQTQQRQKRGKLLKSNISAG